MEEKELQNMNDISEKAALDESENSASVGSVKADPNGSENSVSYESVKADPNGSENSASYESMNTAPDESENMSEESGKSGFKAWMDSLPARSVFIMLLAGLYLVYTGYSLLKNMINGVEGGSPVFVVAGIIFILAGGFMAFVGGRGYMIEEKRKQAERRKQAEEEQKNKRSGTRMSIAERARMTASEEDEDDPEE